MNFKLHNSLQQGLTLIELIIVIAIMGIVAGIAFFGVQQIQTSNQGSAFIVGKEVLRNWSIMALSDEGAELTIKSLPTETVWTISSLGGNSIIQTYHLPANVTLSLNGTVITCVALDPEGFITPITGCATSIPSNSYPEWGISLDGQYENL